MISEMRNTVGADRFPDNRNYSMWINKSLKELWREESLSGVITWYRLLTALLPLFSMLFDIKRCKCSYPSWASAHCCYSAPSWEAPPWSVRWLCSSSSPPSRDFCSSDSRQRCNGFPGTDFRLDPRILPYRSRPLARPRTCCVRANTHTHGMFTYMFMYANPLLLCSVSSVVRNTNTIQYILRFFFLLLLLLVSI